MQIGRYDYPSQFGDNIDFLLKDIRRMFLAGSYVLTDEVRDFEKAFAAYLGVRYAYGVGTGTDALTLALMTLGVKPGDEVVTQANTFYATAAAIRLVGATPVLVDAREDTFLIDIRHVPEVLSSRTRAVIPVHLYGKPTPLDSLLAMAAAHGFDIIEDAAQAHGAQINGRNAGTSGIIGCFSFHPSKNLSAAGDGGAIVTADPEIALEIARRRDLGQEGQGNHRSIGLNSKLDAIQARILAWKLPQLDIWNANRRRIAQCYRERLVGLPISFQQADAGEEHVYHLFQIRTDQRDRLMSTLRQSGIDVVIRYPCPIHLQPAFVDCGWRAGQFPVAERLSAELLCLPMHPTLSSDQIDYTCDHIRRFFKS